MRSIQPTFQREVGRGVKVFVAGNGVDEGTAVGDDVAVGVNAIVAVADTKISGAGGEVCSADEFPQPMVYTANMKIVMIAFPLAGGLIRDFILTSTLGVHYQKAVDAISNDSLSSKVPTGK